MEKKIAFLAGAVLFVLLLVSVFAATQGLKSGDSVSNYLKAMNVRLLNNDQGYLNAQPDAGPGKRPEKSSTGTATSDEVIASANVVSVKENDYYVITFKKGFTSSDYLCINLGESDIKGLGNYSSGQLCFSNPQVRGYKSDAWLGQAFTGIITPLPVYPLLANNSVYVYLGLNQENGVKTEGTLDCHLLPVFKEWAPSNNEQKGCDFDSFSGDVLGNSTVSNVVTLYAPKEIVANEGQFSVYVKVATNGGKTYPTK